MPPFQEQLLVGTARWVYGRFYDEDHDLADPTTITLTVTEPDGTSTDHEYGVDLNVERVSEGVYRYLVLFDTEGAWLFTWTGTGDVAAVDDTFVLARPTGADNSVMAGATCAPWATLADVCSPCDDYEFDIALLDNTLQWATDILYDLTGRRWRGPCTQTYRPCLGESSWWSWRPYAVGTGTGLGAHGASFCSCSTWNTCGCSGYSELILPVQDVSAVTVTIDGLPVSTSRYRVDDGFRLVWQPDVNDPEGRTAWPCCQDLSLPATELGTWELAVTYGAAPPIGGVMSAAILGCQLALSCQPETIGQCRLPKRVTSITRQGVTVAAVLDPLTLFSEGLTGIPEVDLWVQSANRGQQNRNATLFQPGQRTRHSYRVPG